MRTSRSIALSSVPKFSFTLAVILGCLVPAGPSLAATYDISNDFSLASNPNGVWSYGYATGLTGTLTLYDLPSTVGSLQLWQSSVLNVSGDPLVWNNPTSSSAVVPGVPSPLGPHTAAFHPGPNGEFSFFRFTAPEAGSFDVVGNFGALDQGGTDVHILKNGISLFTGEVDPADPSAPFNLQLSLNAGDVLDFAVGFGTDGTYYFDTTSISASISSDSTVVPVPAALPLFATGLAGLGLLGWRRKKAAAG